MLTTHAVGIDLGTTYSCIAYLNEQGEPVSIPNREGEISTPSVVMYDRGEEIVGTEALRNSIMSPLQVVQNSKRFMGDPAKVWTIEGRNYTPVDIATAILKKLIGDAQQQIGSIERAVITVPAQFSERQRLATVEAGRRAGLKHVDIINEPVAAALCYVLGTEGLWFSQLTDEQRILVYDLGGGTFDLSLVSYQKDQVKVIASTGDLHLGGIDWNQCLLNAVADQFAKEFGEDPRRDPESLQHLAWEVEQCKRSLTVRPRAALIVQHAAKRKTYQIEREQFNTLTQHLLKRTLEITQRLIDQYKKGSAHLDLTVLSTGGSSRMPMVDDLLRKLKGTSHSKVLSPDQSIAHGATYYAGMLLTSSEFVHAIVDQQAVARLSRMKQQSVNARALGILIRDVNTNQRVPYYLVPANSTLPASAVKVFGTVSPNQKRVTLSVIESGANPGDPYVAIGNCTIDGLPPNLPAESRIEVTIKYDSSARIEVSAREMTGGKEARVELRRDENLVTREVIDDEIAVIVPGAERSAATTGAAPVKDKSKEKRPARPTLDLDETPVLLCQKCEQPLNVRGECPACGPRVKSRPDASPKPAAGVKPVASVKPAVKPVARPVPSPAQVKPAAGAGGPPGPKPVPPPVKGVPPAGSKKPVKPAKSGTDDPGEEEFWKYVGQ